MFEFLWKLFDPHGFTPRSQCGGEWNDELIRLHNVSDALIWLSYLAIPVILVYFVRRRRDIPFSWMFLMFGLFIISCGFTHLLEIVMFYNPLYRLAGLVKLVTALASVGTVAALVPLVPKVLTLRSPKELEREVAERRKAEDALQRVNADLELQVQKRTQELLQANRALKQEVDVRRLAEERLRLAVSAAHLGTWHWNLTTKQLEWSPECKALFGLVPEATVDYPKFLAAVDPADRERTDAATWQSLENKTDYDIEYRVHRPDGVRWLAAKGRGFYNGAGEAVRMEGVVLDVTGRKQMEEQLRQRAAELAEADRNKDDFLAMLAHELRNPLAPVRNALQVMSLCDLPDPRLRWSREVMDRQVRHIVRLVDDLLDVARIRGGLIALRKEIVDLQSILDRAVETVQPFIDAKLQTLTVQPPAAPVELEADPTRLAQVVSNLLNNAAKYTPEGGRIELAAERAGDALVIRVKDDGVGMRRSLLPKVFDLFIQGDRSLARTEGGLGIGLTLVRSLVASHGGTVGAYSEGEGKGSEFVVRLPLHAGAPAPDANPGAPAPPVASTHRILIVDDNQDGADSLALLMRNSGHQVRTAYDGHQALNVAVEFQPEIVILDIGLPRMDGYEVARRLRKELGMAKRLLVALTGYGQEEDRRKAMEAGFDVHLVKPADMETLQKIVAGASRLP